MFEWIIPLPFIIHLSRKKGHDSNTIFHVILLFFVLTLSFTLRGRVVIIVFLRLLLFLLISRQIAALIICANANESSFSALTVFFAHTEQEPRQEGSRWRAEKMNDIMKMCLWLSLLVNTAENKTDFTPFYRSLFLILQFSRVTLRVHTENALKKKNKNSTPTGSCWC